MSYVIHKDKETILVLQNFKLVKVILKKLIEINLVSINY